MRGPSSGPLEGTLHQRASRGGRLGRTFRVVGVVLILGAGCASGPRPIEVYSPFVLRPAIAGRPRACFTAIGHTPGNIPAPFGGECYCTPTPELGAALAAHPRTQHLRLEDVVRFYERMGVKTELDHTHCNNRCEWGPHVSQGGKCLVSPQPGTTNYERVLHGRATPPMPQQGDDV